MSIKVVCQPDDEEEVTLTLDRNYEAEEVTVKVDRWGDAYSIILPTEELRSMLRMVGL